ncbi:MAG: signal peptidase I [Acholeplasmataceae bacterium]|jgi:signal peptidase|nr:signal peptidase I [Acholeplasmataceae bacterium]
MKLKIKNILFYFFTALLLLIIITEILPIQTTMKVLGFKGYSVASGSMEPVIMTGDYIVITRTDVNDLDKDDIVSFYAYLPTTTGGRSRQIVTHYIYEKVEDGGEVYYITYSEMDTNPVDGVKDIDFWRDENNQPTFIYPEDIIGKYSFRIPVLGTIIMEANKIVSNPMLLVLIAINVGIVVVLIKYITKKPKKDDEK